MTDTVPAAATGLPTVTHPNVYPRFTQAEPISGVASRRGRQNGDDVEQARAMNAIMAELNTILGGVESVQNLDALGGAHV